jgi:hypothetical protein
VIVTAKAADVLIDGPGAGVLDAGERDPFDTFDAIETVG